MQVETYEVTEFDCEGEPEIEAEAIELIEKLGLEGQQKLLKKSDDGTETRIPYRKMTSDEREIYKTILSANTKLNDYSDDPIPVRVLQVAAHATDLFEFVEVWHKPSADIEDPVLVGVNGGEYSSNREFFILARWGEELLPLSSLREIATKLKRGRLIGRCQEIISECKTLIEYTTSLPDSEILDKKDPTFYKN